MWADGVRRTLRRRLELSAACPHAGCGMKCVRGVRVTSGGGGERGQLSLASFQHPAAQHRQHSTGSTAQAAQHRQQPRSEEQLTHSAARDVSVSNITDGRFPPCTSSCSAHEKGSTQVRPRWTQQWTVCRKRSSACSSHTYSGERTHFDWEWRSRRVTAR